MVDVDSFGSLLSSCPGSAGQQRVLLSVLAIVALLTIRHVGGEKGRGDFSHSAVALSLHSVAYVASGLRIRCCVVWKEYCMVDGARYLLPFFLQFIFEAQLSL